MRKTVLAFLAAIAVAIPSYAIAAGGDSSAKKKYDPPRVGGRISFYSGGTTADGSSATEPGIAMREGPYGRFYCVTLHRGRVHAVLEHFDYGPAVWTGRAIDITYAGLAKFEGHGSIATDEYAKARLLPRKRGPAWRCGVR